MNKMLRILPWVVLLFGVIYACQNLVKPDKINSPFDLGTFRALPVSAHGRTKPLDTVARNNLMMFSGRQSLRTEEGTLPAIEWYLELLTDSKKTTTREVFRIDHPDVLALLGLGDEKRTRFSYSEIVAKGSEINKQAQMASRVKGKERDPFQNAVITLYQRLTLFGDLSMLRTPYIIPPLQDGSEWRSFDDALSENPEDPNVSAWLSILKHYSNGDVDLFNEELSQYATSVNEVVPDDVRKSKSEVLFNHVQPFYTSLVLYVMAFLFGCFGMLLSQLSKERWSKALFKSMTSLIVVAFVVQTIGIASRVYLQGRPPVTNLYSSAVFVGWFCVIIGLIVDRKMKLGLGGLMASVLGFCSLIIAHNLGGSGDTMEMMQAVLDSNFWLATHVVVITIGYSAAFFAGFLGTAYVLLGVFTKTFDRERGKSLASMTYGVVCFAAFMSFVGTVLGGIWADQSWGRFWGWDAKENGAAIIVLMTLLILHARWCGMIRDRGLAVLAISCNIITAWSWFGTNMLGVGLHSYGFTQSAVFWIVLYVASQLLLMGIGLLPMSLWRSKFQRAHPQVFKTDGS
jgi:ABC-type transport system involved in cytochrome c biogenesis permease subunit